MVGKADQFETDIVALIFNATAIADLADDDQSSPLTSLYLSLHTADPTDSGNQESSEADYGSYARQAVARSTVGWTVASGVATLAANVDFPEATSGSNLITHFAVGTLVSGTGKILYSGETDPDITVTTGIVPRLDTGTTVTEA